VILNIALFFRQMTVFYIDFFKIYDYINREAKMLLMEGTPL